MNGQICVVNPVNKGITNKQCSLNILTLYIHVKYIPVFTTRLFGFLFLPDSYSFFVNSS